MLIRLNRHNTSRNFADRFTGICSNDNEQTPSSGGDPGGGGGGMSGTPGPSGGGQVQQDAGHSFGNPSPPSQNDANRVANLLSKGSENVLSTDDIAALVRFDAPFKQKAPATQPNAATAVQQTPSQQQQTKPQTQQPPAQPTLSPDAQALITALKQQLGNVAPQQPANPNPAPQETQPVPYYGGEVQALQVSPQILAGLLGTEDAAVLAQSAPAVNTLVNGIMNRVMQDMSARMQASIAAALTTHVPQQIRTAQTTSELESKFYAKHAYLKTPALQPMVNQISGLYAVAMTKTDPNFQWDDKAFDTVAQLVNRQFERTYGFPIPVTTPAPLANAPKQQNPAAPQNPPAQPYMSSGGARPPVVSTPPSQSADVLAFVT